MGFAKASRLLIFHPKRNGYRVVMQAINENHANFGIAFKFA